MVIEAVITAPFTGQHLLGWLYAHEQVRLFNCSWELRETFLGDIYDIRGMLNAKHQQDAEEAYLEELRRELAFDYAYDRFGNLTTTISYFDESGSESSGFE